MFVAFALLMNRESTMPAPENSKPAPIRMFLHSSIVFHPSLTQITWLLSSIMPLIRRTKTPATTPNTPSSTKLRPDFSSNELLMPLSASTTLTLDALIAGKIPVIIPSATPKITDKSTTS